MKSTASNFSKSKSSSTQLKIIRSAGTITFALIIGRIFGFAREAIFAPIFGVGYQMDAYVAARTFPDLLFNLVLTGVIGFALVPAFINYVESGREEEGWAVSYAVLRVLILFAVIIVILGVAASDLIVGILTPGLDEETKELAVLMTRMLLPSLIIVTITGVTKGLLNAIDHFAVPAWGTAILNFTVIIVVVIFSKDLGIIAAIVGVLAGAVFRLLPQLYILIHKGGFYRSGISMMDARVKKILSALGPILLIQVLLYGRFIVERMIASTLSEGSLSILNYAYRLAELPVTLGGAAIGIATFPILSKQAARDNRSDLWNTTSFNMKMLGLIIIPSSVFLYLFSGPIVSLIYERGAFTQEVSRLTSSVLSWYSIGLFGASAVTILTPTFYAFRQSKIALISALISIIITLVFGLIIANKIGVSGISIGSTIGWLSNMIMLDIMLRRKLNITRIQYKKSNPWSVIIRTLLAAMIMGFFAKILYQYLWSVILNPILLARILSLSVTLVASSVMYLILLHIFKVDEVERLFSRLITAIIR